VPTAPIFFAAFAFTGAFDDLLAIGEAVGEHVNCSKWQEKK
jgi:hypothetical protein